MLLNAAFIVLQLLSQLTFSAAYSWHLNSTPKQCSNLSISVTGSDGVPPYHVLVVPVGPPKTKAEVRGVIDKSFNENSFSFAINYPAGTQFVAVVSWDTTTTYSYFFLIL